MVHLFHQNSGYDVFNSTRLQLDTQLVLETWPLLETRLLFGTRLLLEVLCYACCKL